MTWRLEVVGDWEYKRMQKQQWDFQANASGGRMMPVEGHVHDNS
jgi:hypothetical protein